MDRHLHLFERDGWRWRERSPPRAIGIDHVNLAFDAEERLLLTTAEEVRVFGRDLELVDLLPNLDEVGLVQCRAMPEAGKVVTIATNFVAREHWTDFERVLAEAERLLALRAGRRVGQQPAATSR